jgi:hypothetical protein
VRSPKLGASSTVREQAGRSGCHNVSSPTLEPPYSSGAVNDGYPLDLDLLTALLLRSFDRFADRQILTGIERRRSQTLNSNSPAFGNTFLRKEKPRGWSRA